MIKIVKQIPNLLTLSNLFIGCFAIIQLFSERIEIACLLIFLAAVIDFFDGFVARALNAQSPMGKELDSLADCVTFGVVPGLILYQLLANAYYLKTNAIDTPVVLFCPALLVSCMSAYRLARFNIAENKLDRFNGLPTPAMALFVACLPMLIFYGNAPKVASYILNNYVLYGLIAVLCYLMISPHRLFKLSPKAMLGKQYAMRWVLLAIALVSIILFKWMAALFILPAYIICSKIEFSFLRKDD